VSPERCGCHDPGVPLGEEHQRRAREGTLPPESVAYRSLFGRRGLPPATARCRRIDEMKQAIREDRQEQWVREARWRGQLLLAQLQVQLEQMKK